MKHPLKIILFVLVFCLAAFAYHEKIAWYSSYPAFDLYQKTIVKLVIFRTASETQFSKASPNTLVITIKGDSIHIPWTLYLPFFQFGKITASRHFDVHLGDYFVNDDSISITQDIHRFGIIPKLTLKKRITSDLSSAMTKSVNQRIKEGKGSA
jgi:hypothetical protein